MATVWEMPARTMFLIPERRRSWKLKPGRPAAWQARTHGSRGPEGVHAVRVSFTAENLDTVEDALERAAQALRLARLIRAGMATDEFDDGGTCTKDHDLLQCALWTGRALSGYRHQDSMIG
jgi:hypothetical protein